MVLDDWATREPIHLVRDDITIACPASLAEKDHAALSGSQICRVWLIQGVIKGIICLPWRR